MGGRDEGVGQIVDGQIATGVEQRLSGVGHGRTHRDAFLGGQRALVGEPVAEQRLHGPGLGGEPPRDGIEEPLVAVALGVRSTDAPIAPARAVGGDETPEQIHPVHVRQPQPPPEPRPELAVHPVPARLPDDASGEPPQDPEVRTGIGHPEQRLREQVNRPPAGVMTR